MIVNAADADLCLLCFANGLRECGHKIKAANSSMASCYMQPHARKFNTGSRHLSLTVNCKSRCLVRLCVDTGTRIMSSCWRGSRLAFTFEFHVNAYIPHLHA